MYYKRFLTLLPLFIVIFALSACNAVIRGSGDLVTETRQVSNFDSIDLSGSGEVIITQGGSETLSIETDDNVMEFVNTEVEDGTLKLGFKPGVKLISPSQLTFYVEVIDLQGLAVSGSGDIKSEMLETDRLDANVSGSGGVRITDLSAGEVKARISGSGEVNLDGNASFQDVEISGSGKYLAGDVCSASVEVSVSGSGEATVCATESLDANVNGSGTVDYYGKPSVNSSSSGSGSINSLGEK